MSGKTIIGISLGVIFLIVLGFAAVPSASKKALQREEKAMEQLSSWRIETDISRKSRTRIRRVHAAQCPDREHVLERNEGDFAEYIRVGDDEYYRKNSYQWIKGSPGADLLLALPTLRPCLSNPGEPSSRPPGGAEAVRLELEAEMKDGNIEKGVQKNFKGTPCQEWTVTRLTSSNRMGGYITCLSLNDGLPVYTRDNTENFYMYYTWGAPVEIDPPDLTPPGKMPAPF